MFDVEIEPIVPDTIKLPPVMLTLLEVACTVADSEIVSPPDTIDTVVLVEVSCAEPRTFMFPPLTVSEESSVCNNEAPC